MKNILLIFIILFSSLIGKTCQFSVLLYDSYGDGWTSNTITIKVNGTTVLNNITLATGSGPVTFTFNANTGENVVITFYDSGSWPEECSYIIKNPNGVNVFSGDQYGGSFVANCPTPTCSDGIMNGDETGIDCGGATCPVCPPPTCTDGMMNGDETGIDCGGTTCSACPVIWNIDNVDGQTITTCGGTLYDSGGPSSDYSSNEDYSVAFCSGTSDCLNIDFQGSFNAESGYDYVYIHDGINISANLLDDFTGSILPSTTTTSGNCVTIRFTSDGYVEEEGFNLQISCTSVCYVPPPPPTNDEPCNAFNLNVSATCNFTQYTSENATGTMSVATPSCAYSYMGGDVWFTATVPSSGLLAVQLEELVMTEAGITIYSGSNCNSLTEIACEEQTWGMPATQYIMSSMGLAGQSIWIRVWEPDNDNAETFNICAYEPPPFLEVNPNLYTPQQLVQNVLITGCLSASNVTYSGSSEAIGYFQNGNSVGFEKGIVLSSGKSIDIMGYGNNTSSSTDFSYPGDGTLDNIVSPDFTNDASILEFDFVPSSDTLSFRYLFGSDEYPEYVFSFNDVFGFFLTGPNPLGAAYNNTNIALIPVSPPVPVSIYNINNGSNTPPNGPCENCQFYVDNTSGNYSTSLDGFTVPLTAMAIVTPCSTYHIKLVIADVNDGILDSGVLLEAGSFSSGGVVSANHFSAINISNEVLEGCDNYFVFARTDSTNMSDTLFIQLNINGTAINGTDISFIPDTLILFPNQIYDTLFYTVFADSLTEPTEYFTFSIPEGCPCGNSLVFDTIFIINNLYFEAQISNDTIICSNQSTFLNTSVNQNINPSFLSYLWSTGETTTSITVSPNVTTTYYVTISDPCSQDTVLESTVNVIPPLSSNFSIIEDTLCLNQISTITFNGSSTSSAQFQWTFAGGTPSNSSTQGPHLVSWNNTGTFQVTLSIDDNGCLDSTSSNVTVFTIPTSPFTTTTILCNGDSTVITYTGNAPSSSNYTWDFDGGTIESGSGQGPYNITWVDGTYDISLYVEQNGCYSDTTVVQIVSPSALGKPNVDLVHNSCFNDSLGSASLTITGGTIPYSYTWSPTGFSGSGTDFYSNLPAGNYGVTVTDTNGCEANTSFIITQPTELISTAVLVKDANCGQNNGQAKVTSVTGGIPIYSYLWNNGYNPNIASVDSLPEGYAIVTVTDSNGCTDTNMVNVGNLNGVTCDIIDSVNVLCNGGNNGSATVEMTANGVPSYTYTWANGSGTVIQINNNSSTTDKINNLTAGIYTVTIKDDVNCSASASIVINQPTKLIADIVDSTFVSCFGGSDGAATVSANNTGTPTYTYLWTNLDTNPIVTGLSSGLIGVTITDANGCKANTSVVINQPSKLNSFISNSSSVSCFGLNDGSAQVSPTGGTSPYFYNWMSGGTSDSHNSLYAGKETVTVTDSKGCTSIANVTIAQPDSISIAFQNITMPKCFGNNNGSVTSVVSGGTPSYSYVYWSNGANVGSTGTNLSAGINTLIITDLNACKDSSSFILTQPTKLNPVISYKYSPICYGQCNGKAKIDLFGSGTPNYSYSWSSAAVTDTVNNLCAGKFKVTVTDANGCSANITDSLVTPKPYKINADKVSATICKGQSVPINATPIMGGITPFNYYWNNILLPSPINVSTLKDTLIYLNAIDANGCSSNTVIIKIGVFDNIVATIDASDNSICPGDSILIFAEITGGNGGPYICKLNDLNLAVPPVEVFPEGVDTIVKYILTVSDYCGSPIGKDSLEIEILPAATNNFKSDTTYGCQPLIVNFIESSPNDGQTYYWQFGDNENNNYSTIKNPTHTFYSDGIFDVTLSITSTNGCINNITKEEMITVYKNPESIFLPDPLQQSIISPIIYFQNTSTTKYSCFWDFGDEDESSLENPEHEYDLAGTYNVQLIIIDENGCTDTSYNEVIIKDEHLFYAPTAFSPDNDGVNETFYIKNNGIDPSNYKMLIYNRWGELIFETKKNDKTGAWDGKVKNGAVAPSGVYVWYAIYRDFKNVEHQKSGNVTLIR